MRRSTARCSTATASASAPGRSCLGTNRRTITRELVALCRVEVGGIARLLKASHQSARPRARRTSSLRPIARAVRASWTRSSALRPRGKVWSGGTGAIETVCGASAGPAARAYTGARPGTSEARRRSATSVSSGCSTASRRVGRSGTGAVARPGADTGVLSRTRERALNARERHRAASLGEVRTESVRQPGRLVRTDRQAPIQPAGPIHPVREGRDVDS